MRFTECWTNLKPLGGAWLKNGNPITGSISNEADVSDKRTIVLPERRGGGRKSDFAPLPRR